jgi:hypothetical protein
MKTLLLSIALLVCLTLTQAQTTVPSPESYFGFSAGEWHLRPDQITDYMKVLAQTSSRVKVEQYGETYEKRPLLLVTITSPENLGRLQEIKDQHRALSVPALLSAAQIQSMPVVVWLGYSVHGNEASGSNAAVRVAYQLASAQSTETRELLANTIVLIDPMINPDGLGRFSQWVNSHHARQPVADGSSREHAEAWPGGRSNHYWFDLNRDWMPLQHPESRARLKQYYEWMPNIVNDHHEMGSQSTFFFQPGAPGRTNPYSPKRVEELTQAIARFHAQALDQIGSLYFTKEEFDDFYIGKGSSYPDITGSVGILYEQASSRGLVAESANGDLTFSFAIRNHVTASLSVLKAAQSLRVDLLSHQHDFFVSALKEAERASVKGYVFGSPSDASRNFHFIEILRRHQIDVYELGKQFKNNTDTFVPGTAFVVPTNQKQYRLISALFEKRTSFTDSVFYDISGWTLPLAFDIPCLELKTPAQEYLGKRIEWPTPPAGALVTAPGAYAYAFDWQGYYAPRGLYRLQKAGIKTKVATRPFEALTPEGKHRFDYGSIIIPIGIQKDKADTLSALLALIARDDEVHVYSIATGMSSDGSDLGSPTFDALQLPKVMLVAGPGISSTDVGEAWHLLDYRFGMEVSLVEPQAIPRANLGRYSVIVLVNGTYTSIDSASTAALRRWVENGGTLIAMERAVEWASNNRFANVRFRRADQGRKDTVVTRRPYSTEQKYSAAQNIDGAIVEALADRTHPLLFGYAKDRLSVFRENSIFMEPSRDPYATPLVYSMNPLISGYIHRDIEPLLRNSAAIIVSGLRSGRVILMADNPNFRAFWYGTNKLFLNAIFFGPAIRQNSPRTEE